MSGKKVVSPKPGGDANGKMKKKGKAASSAGSVPVDGSAAQEDRVAHDPKPERSDSSSGSSSGSSPAQGAPGGEEGNGASRSESPAADSAASASKPSPKAKPKPVSQTGRRKINIEYIEEKSRRHVTFSKRKSGLIKKAYELSTLTGTQVLVLVASERGNVFTFATPRFQPIIMHQDVKAMITKCLADPAEVNPVFGPFSAAADPQGMQQMLPRVQPDSGVDSHVGDMALAPEAFTQLLAQYQQVLQQNSQQQQSQLLQHLAAVRSQDLASMAPVPETMHETGLQRVPSASSAKRKQADLEPGKQTDTDSEGERSQKRARSGASNVTDPAAGNGHEPAELKQEGNQVLPQTQPHQDQQLLQHLQQLQQLQEQLQKQQQPRADPALKLEPGVGEQFAQRAPESDGRGLEEQQLRQEQILQQHQLMLQQQHFRLHQLQQQHSQVQRRQRDQLQAQQVLDGRPSFPANFSGAPGEAGNAIVPQWGQMLQMMPPLESGGLATEGSDGQDQPSIVIPGLGLHPFMHVIPPSMYPAGIGSSAVSGSSIGSFGAGASPSEASAGTSTTNQTEAESNPASPSS